MHQDQDYRECWCCSLPQITMVCPGIAFLCHAWEMACVLPVSWVDVLHCFGDARAAM